MGPGGVATIIASCALIIIALAIAYFIIRAGRLMDEVQKTIENVNRIATTAENFTEKLSGLVSNLSSANSGIVKLVGSIVSLFPNRRNSNSQKENEF